MKRKKILTSGVTALTCAKRLKYKCRAKQVDLANPGIGVEQSPEIKSSTDYKNVYQLFKIKTPHPNPG